MTLQPAQRRARSYNRRMIASEPTLARLSSAQSLLLDPFGLTPDHLKKALAEIMVRGADDADLYF